MNRLGLLGVVSLLSYTAAVLLAPLGYPGYHWMSQAVSDLSAENAPSKLLWNQLGSLYGVCGIISIMMVCVFIQGKLNKTLRAGIYTFATMCWVSNVGYTMFPPNCNVCGCHRNKCGSTRIFGIFERFSVIAAGVFNAVLGVYLFLGFPQKIEQKKR